jgi:hypothetical protein
VERGRGQERVGGLAARLCSGQIIIKNNINN